MKPQTLTIMECFRGFKKVAEADITNWNNDELHKVLMLQFEIGRTVAFKKVVKNETTSIQM